MSSVILDMAMSLDGFAADRDSVSLYPIDDLRGIEALYKLIERAGAAVMGRRSYDMARGDFTGYEHQQPIFVLTHQPPQTPARGLTFTFVTDSPESAVRQAKAAAGGKDVVVIGPSVAQQMLRHGLLDEIWIRLVPVLLGDGLRLFDHLDYGRIRLEPAAANNTRGITNLRFGVPIRTPAGTPATKGHSS